MKTHTLYLMVHCKVKDKGACLHNYLRVTYLRQTDDEMDHLGLNNDKYRSHANIFEVIYWPINLELM